MGGTDPSFDELVRQVALGQGFQLIVLVTPSAIDPFCLAHRVSEEVASLRGEPQDVLVIDPYLATLPGDLLTPTSLRAQVLAPLLNHAELHRARDPLVVVDTTHGQPERPIEPIERRPWEQFLAALNLNRNSLVHRFRGALLLQVTSEFVGILSSAAPDLWSIRSGAIWISEHIGDLSSASRGALAAEMELRRRLVASRGDLPTYRQIAHELASCLRKAGAEETARDLERAMAPRESRPSHDVLLELLQQIGHDELHLAIQRSLPDLVAHVPRAMPFMDFLNLLLDEIEQQDLYVRMIELVLNNFPWAKQRALAAAHEIGVEVEDTPAESKRRGPKVAPTRLPAGARQLFGRDAELAWLDHAWNDGANVASIVAWGGVGKTALVQEWRTRLLARALDVEFVFDWSFYSQGVRERGAVSADNFIREALRFFGDRELAESNASPWDKGARLAELVGGAQSLLILDGLEPLQEPKFGNLREGSIEGLLKGLAAKNAGLCVVTTRVAVHELERFENSTAPLLRLEHLSEQAGAELLRSSFEAGGGPKAVSSTQAEREEISQAVQGHALTLLLLGGYIRRALGDVRRWREIDFARADEDRGGHAFRVMDAYLRWMSNAGAMGQRQLAVLRLLGLFDRPADPGCLAALREGEAIPGLTEALIVLDEQGWRTVVSSLEEMQLIECHVYEPVRVCGFSEEDARLAGQWSAPRGMPKPWRSPEFGPDALVLDAHPLVREYFAQELRQTNEAAWREGHRRLYVYLCESIPYWPEGIEGLQPLYQAVLHGCSAGLIQETLDDVYWARILRGTRYYSTKHLGALGTDLAAMACFFERTWDRASNKLTIGSWAWVLSAAAFRLCALGRLTEALEPMRAGLEMEIKLGYWQNSAIAAGNLSEIELTLGRTSAAVEDAELSVVLADRSGVEFQRMSKRSAVANARHQAGDLASARALFEQAEAMQAQRQPTYPQLYSLQGFQYGDLLLNPAERAAWRAWLREATGEGGLVAMCTEVFARTTQTLAWVSDAGSLLDIALDHLTLGRAAMYAAMLGLDPTTAVTSETALSFAIAHIHLDTAVVGLREAGQLNFLPRGLIARAQLHHLDHRPDLARADLDEAWTLAERGPMPLHQADIQLTRARLFHDRDALAHAREMIIRHSYNRRLPELADTELAGFWPTHTGAPTVARAWDTALRPDVAFLFALPEEFEMIAREFTEQWTALPNPRFHGSDFLFVGPNGYRCVAAIMPRMGPTVAAMISQRLLAWRPAAIVNIGLAGAFVPDLRIGDVIVPRQVDAYDETGKRSGTLWQGRGSAYRPSARLLAAARDLPYTAHSEYEVWRQAGAQAITNLLTGPDAAALTELIDQRILGTRPRLSTQHLASGSFVVASKSFAQSIRQTNGDVHGGEMESAGMLAASEYQREPVETLVVRGISDHVDVDRRDVDHIGAGALRHVAMGNAWRLITTLMGVSALPRAPTDPASSIRTSGVLWREQLALLHEHESHTAETEANFGSHELEEAYSRLPEREVDG